MTDGFSEMPLSNTAKATPAASVSTLDRQTFHEAMALIATPPLFMRFPAALAERFAQQRQHEFERFIGIGAPGAVLVCLLVMIAGNWGFHQELTGSSGRIWWTGAFMNTVIVTLAAVSFLSARVRRHYTVVLGLTGFALMTSVVFICLSIDNPRLSQSMTYVVMFIVTITTLALRLSLPVSGTACLLGGLAGLWLALRGGTTPDWGMLLHYYPGSLAISLFIAWVLERQERLSFLHSLLLAHESEERERLNRELDRLARLDTLTGLANRRSFDERLGEEWERARRDQKPLAVLFIDVDHFKAYNDTYGHGAGDVCLAAVATAINGSLLRTADIASRFGGEEFVVILPGTDAQGAREVAERIQKAVDLQALPHAGSTTASHVTVSIGLTACIPEAGLAQALVESADAALYQAKHGGRHQIVSATGAHGLKMAAG
ncbi:MAG: diguanylate cyclase [Moraxellaceae bacterium]|nr:diguanylate cyclase [Moraxellaceae bacterium]